MMVGRVAPEKNFDLAMTCFEQMRRAYPDMQCVVVGDGPLRAKLAARYPWVHFTGVRRGLGRPCQGRLGWAQGAFG